MLEVHNIAKSFEQGGARIESIRNISLSVPEKKFVAIVGPSGCGKTTLLKMVAGLVEPSSGSLVLDGANILSPGPERGMVFQNFSLFPWLTVRKNIEFGLELQGFRQDERQRRVEYYLKITGLTDFADYFPKDLSGGMQQKVAIARTLAQNPKILLMDEPFASLDAHTRSRMQEFLTDLWENEHKTVVFVTHDVNEAVFLADTVYILSQRPTVVKKVFEVPFARPRKHNLKNEGDFFEFVRRITKELDE